MASFFTGLQCEVDTTVQWRNRHGESLMPARKRPTRKQGLRPAGHSSQSAASAEGDLVNDSVAHEMRKFHWTEASAAQAAANGGQTVR